MKLAIWWNILLNMCSNSFCCVFRSQLAVNTSVIYMHRFFMYRSIKQCIHRVVSSIEILASFFNFAKNVACDIFFFNSMSLLCNVAKKRLISRNRSSSRKGVSSNIFFICTLNGYLRVTRPDCSPQVFFPCCLKNFTAGHFILKQCPTCLIFFFFIILMIHLCIFFFILKA